MEVTCPSCGAVFGIDTSMGDDQVCPACMFPFRLEGEAAQGLPTAMILEVQAEDGQLLGSMERVRIRENIYSGVLQGVERVREAGGEWVAIGSRPEFADVLHLIGVDVAGLAVARQQIKGWKRDTSAGGDKKHPRPQVLPRKRPSATKSAESRILRALGTRQQKLVAVFLVLAAVWLLDLVVNWF